MTYRSLTRLLLFGSLIPAGWSFGKTAAGSDYDLVLDTVISGYDGQTCWMNARAGVIPAASPVILLLTQKMRIGHSDVYFAFNEMRSEDLGQNWSAPVELAQLGRRNRPDGSIVNVSGLTPQWHKAQSKLLGTGNTSHYFNEQKLADPPTKPTFTVYDESTGVWSPWAMVEIPELPKFFHANPAGSQRVDLPDGSILLPFYFKPQGVSQYSVTVMRCTFDGRVLSYVRHGDELTLPFDPASLHPDLTDRQKLFEARQAGLFEPSLARVGGQYFLTMRNRHAAYVAVSRDGLHFNPPQAWTFDDGGPLGNYNTQQHWVVHGSDLYLVYTRRNADNDHVFRHRAPLFMAKIDQDRLCVIRATERVLVPNKGADLGAGFGVTEVSVNETWVTTAEGMSPHEGLPTPQSRGADSRIYAARILWRAPAEERVE